MFKEMIGKLGQLENHHQLLVATVVLIAVVLVSWGVEKIFEDYIFPKSKPIVSYVLAIVLGVIVFLLTKSVLLDVM